MASGLKLGTTLRTALANAMAGLWNSGTVKIYSGSQPADPQTAPSGTLLATINIPSTAFGAASSGVASKSGTWSATVANSGTAGWFRMTSSDTTEIMDGTVDVAGNSPDMVLDSTSLVASGTVTVSTFTITQPQ